jgi:hypothetical protein
MPLDHRTKVFGVREVRIVKLLTDAPGSAATYSAATSTVQASPSPTTTTFSVATGAGANFAVGRVVTVGTQQSVISAISTDAITVSPAFLSAPTSGQTVTQYTGYPITGARGFGITANVTNVDLIGDNQYLDTDSVLHTFDVEIDHAKVSLDLLSLLYGGAITDTGSTPNQQSTWSLLTPPVFNYVRVEARCVAVDVNPNADLHIIIAKAKASDMPLPAMVNENYFIPKLKLKALCPIGTTPPYQVIYNETGIAVA